MSVAGTMTIAFPVIMTVSTLGSGQMKTWTVSQWPKTIYFMHKGKDNQELDFG